MTDDAHATHSEQRCAPVVGRIERRESGVEHRLIEGWNRREQGNDHRHHRLVELEYDVADEAVADDDVNRPAIADSGGQVPAFNVPVKVESCRLEQRMRGFRRRVAFLLLFADAEQPDDRSVPAEDELGIDRAEPGELNQLYGGAIDVGSRVDDDDWLARRWKHSRDCWTRHARETAE